MPGKFNFTIFGGLHSKFYFAFRALREKYKLDDRGMIECMVWYLLRLEKARPEDLTQDFGVVVDDYLTTAPVDITLPEVV